MKTLILGPLLFLIFLFLPTPLSEVQHSLAAIMLWVVVWWVHPVIPLTVTGLIGVSLVTILGVAPWSEALKGFSNPVIYLFMGGFFLARAMHVQEVDVWIARKCLAMKVIRGNPQRVFIAVTLLTAFFSSIISNTATTAMFIPIALSLFTYLQIKEGSPSFKLLLLIPYAATIGGIGTPIGSPPNVIALSLMETMTGIRVSFLEWMAMMIPIMMICLMGLFLIFRKELKDLPTSGLNQMAPPDPLNKSQKRLLILLSSTVLLWMLPGFVELSLGSNHHLTLFIIKRMPESMIAIFMSSMLFIIPGKEKEKLLLWKDAQHIDWGVLLLFGSAISLGQLMFETGLISKVGASLPFSSLPFAMALLLITTITLFSTEIVTNSASANLLVPLVITTAPFSDNPKQGVLCVALACSMAFMMPVGTPPNAIAYGTGKLQLSWLLHKGIYLNVICLLTIWGMGYFIF
jgi:solute carrier family 13 (sodium-dependent dicarboxylate transporter), member 2/3/5